MIDPARTAPVAPTAPTTVATPLPAVIAQLDQLLSQVPATRSVHQHGGAVADAHRGIRPSSTPGRSIERLIEQVALLRPQLPSVISVPRTDTLLRRPEDLMRPGQDQRGMLGGALKQLVQYERVLGIQQPPISPNMPLDEQFANIDRRYNAVRHELNRADRGDRELPPTVNATRVREVLDLAKERLASVGFESSWSDSGHVKRPGLIMG